MFTSPRIMITCGLCLLFVQACARDRVTGPPPALSAMQRAALQTRELEGDFDTAFAALVSVLQDEGWQIAEIDRASGLIQAESLRQQMLWGPDDDWRPPDDAYFVELRKAAEEARAHNWPYPEWTRWETLTAQVEPWGTGTVRVRLSMVKVGDLPSGAQRVKKETIPIPGKQQSVVVEDAETYTWLFQLLQKAMFVRQGLKAKP